MTDALRCIRCDAELSNVEDSATNQPYEGTSFSSTGHYGSTVFDPMDLSEIEINVCDKCLREVAAKGDYVLAIRFRKPIYCAGRLVGMEYLRDNERSVPWNPDLPEDGRKLEIDPWEAGDFSLSRNIAWFSDAVNEIRKSFADVIAEHDGGQQ